MHRIVVNVQTGTQEVVDLTPEEEAAALAYVEPPPPAPLEPVEILRNFLISNPAVRELINS